MTQGSLLASRFKENSPSIYPAIDLLFSAKDRVFPNQEALDEWLEKQPFSPGMREKISQAVPHTKKVADDARGRSRPQKTARPLGNHPSRKTPRAGLSSTPPASRMERFTRWEATEFSASTWPRGRLTGDTPWELEAIAGSVLVHGDLVIALVAISRLTIVTRESWLGTNKEVSESASPPFGRPRERLDCLQRRQGGLPCRPRGWNTFWKGPEGVARLPSARMSGCWFTGRMKRQG